MPDHAMNVTTGTAPLPAPLAAPTPDHRAPPSAGEREVSGAALLDALDRLERAQPATPGASPSRLAADVRELVAAHLEGRGGGVNAWLRAHPESLEALGELGREGLDDRVEAELNRQRPDGWLRNVFLRSESIVHVVANHMESAVLAGVHAQAMQRVNRALEGTEALRADLPAAVDSLRSAPSGTLDRTLADLLGVRGDEGDIERVGEGLGRLSDELGEFQTYMSSPNLWEPAEFPVTMSAVAERLGLDGAEVGTLAEEATSPSHPLDTGLRRLGFSGAVRETLAFVGAVGLEVNVATALVGVGLYLVDVENERRHASMVELGHSLGL